MRVDDIDSPLCEEISRVLTDTVVVRFVLVKEVQSPTACCRGTFPIGELTSTLVCIIELSSACVLFWYVYSVVKPGQKQM